MAFLPLSTIYYYIYFPVDISSRMVDVHCSIFILKYWKVEGWKGIGFINSARVIRTNNPTTSWSNIWRWGGDEESTLLTSSTLTQIHTSFSFNGRQCHLIFKCGYVDWKASLPFLLPWRLTYLEQCIVTKYSIGAIVPAPWAHWARAPDTATRLPAAQLLVSWYGRGVTLGPASAAEHSFINSSRSG